MLSRATTIRANAPSLRRVAGRRVCQRFQSNSAQLGNSSSTHFAAGVAGGAVVLVAGYTWYHYSGLKDAVQTSKQVKAYFESAKDKVIVAARENTPRAGEALAKLRSVAKSYAGFIPGAGTYVDTTFDTLDELRETHGEEMDKILQGANEELVEVVQKGGADATTAAKVFDVIKRRIGELQQLGLKVGGDVLDKNPKVKEKLGNGYEEFKKLAESSGPEAKKIFDDTSNQIKDMMSNGLNAESLENARQLLKEKSSQIQKMAMAAGATGASSISGGWDKLQEFVKAVPGGEEELKKVPHIKDFMEVASQRGEDAKALAKETYQDILKVLEEKGQKAKKLSEKTKSEAKDAKDSKSD